MDSFFQSLQVGCEINATSLEMKSAKSCVEGGIKRVEISEVMEGF